MAINQVKRLREDLENNTSQYVGTITKTATTAAYAGTSAVATTAVKAGTADHAGTAYSSLNV